MADIKKKPIGITETILRDAHQSLIVEIDINHVFQLVTIGHHLKGTLI